ncbi:PAAR domain-containing protein [Pseudomonas savastanoi pv. phaseolicola]|uniref:Rhs protein n=3 Tax=Pseudomonas savastanoi TaxID=29438 RepID=A0A3M4MGR6_PSESG|nr:MULTISPECIES: GH-E family nuclease [Pseudomonas]AAZ34154.1 Rhs family protein [Pseudomonas savastanoi pv. phaseolicola 1448A]KPB40215.1 Rhs family protein [Pseudomonas savastanoi pv. phaseolicola]KPB46659.1 Rhs family protein [Pseudomonas savastanoi pv. phaseolicola]KPB65411.1 Rhs family protein [Pseudomonas savastanoi pv. phaseolicola]KPB66892.1 Rhs family protein [Pseudomonas amygdali pv. mellea]
MSAAARLNDPIEHTGSLTGLLAGFAIGAIGAALIVGTGGLAAVAIVGAAAATGAGIGQLVGSMSFCSHQTGQIISGSSNVNINGKAAARAHVDKASCDDHGPGPKVLAQGSSTVYINGYPAARVNDRTECDAKISAGSNNVFIGGETETTDPISPEVPVLLERGILLIGLASAFVLASPAVVIAGFVGGIAGGTIGNWAGGKLFGEGSDRQKLMAFGGALLGGRLGAKGGKWFDVRYEVKVHGLGSSLGNIKVKPRTANEKLSSSSNEKVSVPSSTNYSRGKFRKNVRKTVWENAEKESPDGIVRDPLLEKPMKFDEPWDMGHKPCFEHWKHVRSAEARGISRKEFLDEYNKVEHYRPELPSSNRSHKGELETDDYYGY